MNYPFRSELISDGVIACISKIDKFNPNVTSNPFSYFTQICYYAFLERISFEKKQTYIKFKSTINSAVMGELSNNNVDPDTSEHVMDNIEFTEDFMDKFVSDFEEKYVKKKQNPTNIKQVEPKGLELFVENEEIS